MKPLLRDLLHSAAFGLGLIVVGFVVLALGV